MIRPFQLSVDGWAPTMQALELSFSWPFFFTIFQSLNNFENPQHPFKTTFCSLESKVFLSIIFTFSYRSLFIGLSILVNKRKTIDKRKTCIKKRVKIKSEKCWDNKTLCYKATSLSAFVNWKKVHIIRNN